MSDLQELEESLEVLDEQPVFVAVSPQDTFDAMYCAQIGAAVLLDKPIVVVREAGAYVPGKLLQVADEVIFADIDTEEGLADVAGAVERVTPE